MTAPRPHGKPTPAGAGPGFNALEGLRKSEERFRLAAQAGKMFVFEWDVDTDAVVLSGECAYVLGINEAAYITSRQVLSKVHPDDRERLTTALAGLTAKDPQTQISHRIVHPDRGVIWVETNGRALFNESGRMLRITGMVADITVRRLAEIELAMANDRLNLAMDAGKSVAWEWDVKSGRDSWF